jgi:hypothetical protein
MFIKLFKVVGFFFKKKNCKKFNLEFFIKTFGFVKENKVDQGKLCFFCFALVDINSSTYSFGVLL